VIAVIVLMSTRLSLRRVGVVAVRVAFVDLPVTVLDDVLDVIPARVIASGLLGLRLCIERLRRRQAPQTPVAPASRSQ